MVLVQASSNRLTASIAFINPVVSPYPRSRARIGKYRGSSGELSAMLRNCAYSVLLRRRNSSAILAATETDRRSPVSGNLRLPRGLYATPARPEDFSRVTVDRA
jgi:hypothetical protein